MSVIGTPGDTEGVCELLHILRKETCQGTPEADVLADNAFAVYHQATSDTTLELMTC